MPAGSGIGTIIVNKSDLLAILQQNKDNHRSVYEQALEKFRNKAVDALDELIKDISRGKVPHNLYIDIPIPEEHTKDYERAIRMLQMHQEATIVLTEQAYSQLVDDDWGWKPSFTASTASYLG